MSYTQGTEVRLWADFSDPETRNPVAPPEVVLTIIPPTGAPFTRSRSAGEVLLDADRPGRFYFVLDTSPAPGTWQYQFEGVGVGAVVERKAITVTKRLTA